MKKGTLLVTTEGGKLVVEIQGESGKDLIKLEVYSDQLLKIMVGETSLGSCNYDLKD